MKWNFREKWACAKSLGAELELIEQAERLAKLLELGLEPGPPGNFEDWCGFVKAELDRCRAKECQHEWKKPGGLGQVGFFCVYCGAQEPKEKVVEEFRIRRDSEAGPTCRWGQIERAINALKKDVAALQGK